MDFANKKVLVVGTGISGVSAVKLLAKKGAHIILMEGNDKMTAVDIRSKFPEDIQLELIIGEIEEEVMQTLDMAVLSPGVPGNLPFVERMRELGVYVMGEIELAYQCERGKLLAITGTNGKTTTTALLGEIAKRYYKDVFVVGNIGLPYTEYVSETTPDSVTVAEISSFQLETIHDFKPEVCGILNITPDHLNRHYTMENYTAIKKSIAKNQTADQVCVLNYEDALLRGMDREIAAETVYYSSRRELEKGAYLDAAQNIVYADGEKHIICSVDELQLMGRHNYENVMAAVAMAAKAGISLDCIREAVKAFKAVEHRIEYVTEKKGVKYYNDSKGTNPDAAIKAIEAMVAPTVLIGGGFDKKSSYDEWVDAFGDKVKCLILLGETRFAIEKAAKGKIDSIILVDSLEEAVKTAAEKAVSGDAVLLSPACASWDMFDSYEERGRLFKEYVRNLEIS